MPSFSYIARLKEGTLDRGTVDAGSLESAREILRKRGLMIEEIRPSDSPPAAISFGNAMPWTTTEDDRKPGTPDAAVLKKDESYLPLTDTLRLFAGWLLAWYALVFLLGSYQLTGRISYDVPFLQALFESSLVLRFSFATFLFLLLTDLHRWLRGNVLFGLGLGVTGVVIFLLFHLNA